MLDKLAEQHPDDDTIVGYAQKIVGEATDFVRQHDLVTVPDKPLKVIVMPEFKRGQGIAYCDSPGPLEKNGETFFACEPTPKDWTKERKESFYREYNNYMVRDLTVHEAMPGHYLQLAHANEFRAPTLVRAIFQSGTFIEGWAVYTEQMMAEAGYGGQEVKMQQLKMRLRVIVNAMIDQGIHTANMSEQDALNLMMKEGFQQEGEAVAKWKRARLGSTQLSTYFVGVTEHLDLRERAKAKAGAAFDLKKYNDSVLSFGSPPASTWLNCSDCKPPNRLRRRLAQAPRPPLYTASERSQIRRCLTWPPGCDRKMRNGFARSSSVFPRCASATRSRPRNQWIE